MIVIDWQFHFRRSRLLLLTILGGHTLALASLALWSGPARFSVPMALVVGFSLVLAWRRPWPVRLSLSHGGDWQVVGSDGHIFRGPIAHGRVLASVMSITLQGHANRPILLLPDIFRDGDHKRLVGLLRHRCGGAAC